MPDRKVRIPQRVYNAVLLVALRVAAMATLEMATAARMLMGP